MAEERCTQDAGVGLGEGGHSSEHRTEGLNFADKSGRIAVKLWSQASPGQNQSVTEK